MILGKPDDKTFSKQPKQQKQTNKHDSLTNVNFSDYAASRYFANRRVVMGVRVDEGLAKRFKQYAKRIYGSVCRAVEVYMVNFIEAAERGVNFCYTNRPLRIEKVVIERNLRSRRKLEFSEVDEGEEELRCLYCGKAAVGKFRYVKTGLTYPLCEFHATAFLNSKMWVVVKDE